jgi:hypothetical protein
MNASLAGLLVFLCVLGASLLGSRLRGVLPDTHLGSDTKDVVRVSAGLIATMAALVLGLLIAEAKGTYDTDRKEVTGIAAQFIFLDRVLAHYGPGAAGARSQLRLVVEHAVNHLWPNGASPGQHVDAGRTAALYRSIEELQPGNDLQRSLKAQAAGLTAQISQTRWLLFEQTGSPISPVILVVMICWMAIVFFSFGLFAPNHGTAKATLIVAALAVSAAIFLILELGQPFSGFIQIPSEPMRSALSQMGN